MTTPLPLPNKPTPAQVREYLFDRYAGINGKITTNVAFDIEMDLGTFMQASINQRRAVTMYLPWHSTVRDSEERVLMVHGAWRTLEENGDTWKGGKTILPPLAANVKPWPFSGPRQWVSLFRKWMRLVDNPGPKRPRWACRQKRKTT